MGNHGRQLFFDSKALGFTEGYAVLFGQAPNINTNVDKEARGIKKYAHSQNARPTPPPPKFVWDGGQHHIAKMLKI